MTPCRTALLVGSVVFMAAACVAAGPFSSLAVPGYGSPQGGSAVGETTTFFEQRIRPVLVEECASCHGARARPLQGALRLDSRAGLMKGGLHGPAIVPGQPEKSLLIAALRHQGRQMPPGKQLPERTVADFEKWIAQGAPWPAGQSAVGSRQSVVGSGGGTGAGVRNSQLTTHNSQLTSTHWAFKPIRRPALPVVKNRAWATSPIDRFILAKLEAKGLTPSDPADRRTLIRRATYDLIGLPPTYEEVKAFEEDRSPDAFAKAVDRLLASPHYGERWGRHWLDVARYADTKDLVLLFGDARVRPYAYTYRDYVIRALNEDTPYDRFIHEQLAADQLDLKGQDWRLAAMGFLTVGRLFDNNIPDIHDDQIDTVTRGLMGLTVSCARCHDHKYDPIPTADYYSLYGVFAGSQEPVELPLMETGALPKAAADFEKAAGVKREEIRKWNEAQFTEITEAARKRTGDYLRHVAIEKPDPLEDAVFYLSLSPEDLRPQITARWRRYLEAHSQPDDPVFGPWHDLMRLPPDRFEADAPAIQAKWSRIPAGTARGQLNPLVAEALKSARLKTPADVPRLYGELLWSTYSSVSRAQVSDTRGSGFGLPLSKMERGSP